MYDANNNDWCPSTLEEFVTFRYINGNNLTGSIYYSHAWTKKNEKITESSKKKPQSESNTKNICFSKFFMRNICFKIRVKKCNFRLIVILRKYVCDFGYKKKTMLQIRCEIYERSQI